MQGIDAGESVNRRRVNCDVYISIGSEPFIECLDQQPAFLSGYFSFGAPPRAPSDRREKYATGRPAEREMNEWDTCIGRILQLRCCYSQLLLDAASVSFLTTTPYSGLTASE
jgi:hypothetical protein